MIPLRSRGIGVFKKPGGMPDVLHEIFTELAVSEELVTLLLYAVYRSLQ